MIYGYIRVSTSQQAEEGQSLEAQRRQIIGYAMMKGFAETADNVEFVIEAGVSGSVPLIERSAGRNMIDRVKYGDEIIVTKLDRMFRSAVDALKTLETMKRLGVAIHMIDLGGDVTGNGISKLVFTILAAVAENERERIAERIRDVKQDQKARGLYLGGDIPYGYKKDGDSLVPNDVELEAIGVMKQMRSANHSYRRIADRVMELFGIDKEPTSIKRIIDREMANA